jgi:hypothetical protein
MARLDCVTRARLGTRGFGFRGSSCAPAQLRFFADGWPAFPRTEMPSWRIFQMRRQRRLVNCADRLRVAEARDDQTINDRKILLSTPFA